MILTDAGALVGLIDADDPHHRTCVRTVARLAAEPMLTTWPCLTEAMYLLGRSGGYRSQAALWGLRSSGYLSLHDLSPDEVDHTEALMRRYSDTPLDVADASLVATAQRLKVRRIFTLDGHFRIYRMPDGSVLEMVPG